MATGRFAPRAIAQIIPDTTTASVATPSSNSVAITGGSRSGDVLFHSFEQFSVSSGQTVQFLNDVDLNTLVTRVTGPQASVIEGTLAAQGTTDVFLLNPNGIVFGPTAQLDVGGSFIATTADSLVFQNNQQFSAIAPQAAPLLTMSAPIGLQYGAQANSIQVTGEGNGFAIDFDTFEVFSTQPRVGLRVPDGNTLALLGGDVVLDGGNLTAREGRVALLGVGPGSAVGLNQDALGWSFQPLDGAASAAVSLENAASVFTSGVSGGAVQIEGQNIDLLAGSTILSNTQGEGASNGVVLKAVESIRLLGFSEDLALGEALLPSSILSEVDAGASGEGGRVALSAPTIEIADGAQVSTSVFGSGLGGNLSVKGEDVLLSGSTPEFGASGFFLSVSSEFEAGTGGAFSLEADRLQIEAGAVIDGSTFGLGNSGGISINANTIDVIGQPELFDASGILSQVEGAGNSGDITIQGDVLNVSLGPSISTRVFGQGDGGDINVLVDQITLKDGFPEVDEFRSGITSSADAISTGQVGDINIVAQQLTIADGSGIVSSTSNAQRAGDTTIRAQSIDLIGVDNAQTGILSVGSVGDGGKIELEADTLSLRNGAQIVTGTLGTGSGNDLQIRANAITLEGRNNEGSSGLYASALNATGSGGSILIETESLDIQNGATINAGNFPSINRVEDLRENSFLPGQGAAGSIDIKADLTRLSNRSSITTSTFSGDQGNIRLESDVIVARDNSAITTNASQTATGGNITLLSDFVIAVPDENSDITANAQQGQGGRVEITAQQIYGLALQNSLSPSSDITASSDIGLDGEVVVNSLSLDPSQDLMPLPDKMADSSDQIVAGCPANQGASFVATGRGGLPDDLASQVRSLPLLPAFERAAVSQTVDVRPLEAQSPESSITEENVEQTAAQAESSWIMENTEKEASLIEAQGWTYDSNGAVALVEGEGVTTSGTQVACLEANAT